MRGCINKRKHSFLLLSHNLDPLFMAIVRQKFHFLSLHPFGHY